MAMPPGSPPLGAYRCPACAAPLPPGASFCTNCGQQLAGSPGALGQPGPSRTSGLAVAALVFGILWLGGIASLVAIVLGIIAIRRVTASQGRERGTGLAIAGLVFGALGLLSTVFLMAIAVPVYNGARARAQDRATQSSLRNTLTGAKVMFTDRESYLDATTSVLQEMEPSLSFVEANQVSTGPTVVSVDPRSDNEFVAASLSASGTCWYIRDLSGPTSAGTSYNLSDGAPCTASAAPAEGWTADDFPRG